MFTSIFATFVIHRVYRSYVSNFLVYSASYSYILFIISYILPALWPIILVTVAYLFWFLFPPLYSSQFISFCKYKQCTNVWENKIECSKYYSNGFNKIKMCFIFYFNKRKQYFGIEYYLPVRRILHTIFKELFKNYSCGNHNIDI